MTLSFQAVQRINLLRHTEENCRCQKQFGIDDQGKLNCDLMNNSRFLLAKEFIQLRKKFYFKIRRLEMRRWPAFVCPDTLCRKINTPRQNVKFTK